jgi:hypothetical protein
MPPLSSATARLLGSSPPASARDAAGRPPETWHRGLSLLAIAGLFLALGPLQASSAIAVPWRGALLTGVYGGLLALAAAVFAVRGRRALAVVDGLVLALGALRACCTFAAELGAGGRRYGTDEGVLIHQAALLLAHGGDIYSPAAHWPLLATAPGVGATPLMGGGYADSYGYPPLPAVLTAAALPFTHGLPTAAVVAFGCQLLAAAAMFVLLPTGWRPSATLLVFGLDFLGGYARQGYAVVMALPLLVVAVASWTRTGAPSEAGARRGGLGRRGVLRAVCLGLAAATQQLAWFLVPFLVLGLWVLRRGDVLAPGAAGGAGTARRPDRATGLTVRWAAVAGGTWLLVQLPFMLRDPGGWLGGILGPLTQDAVPKGIGLIDLAFYLRGESGALDWFGYAAALLLAALLAAVAVAPRRLGAAVVLLPWLPFYLATRSTDDYFTLLAPLWLVGMATAGPPAFARARGVRLRPRRSGGRSRRWGLAVPAALAAGAAGCAAVAVLSPAPLGLRVTGVDGPSGGPPSELLVHAVNRADRPVRPSFGVSRTAVLGSYWTVRSGPAVLPAGAEARYVLRRPASRAGLSGDGPLWLRAVSAQPMTLSSVRVPR